MKATARRKDDSASTVRDDPVATLERRVRALEKRIVTLQAKLIRRSAKIDHEASYTRAIESRLHDLNKRHESLRIAFIDAVEIDPTRRYTFRFLHPMLFPHDVGKELS